jgi:hypothetical protein
MPKLFENPIVIRAARPAEPSAGKGQAIRIDIDRKLRIDRNPTTAIATPIAII